MEKCTKCAFLKTIIPPIFQIYHQRVTPFYLYTRLTLIHRSSTSQFLKIRVHYSICGLPENVTISLQIIHCKVMAWQKKGDSCSRALSAHVNSMTTKTEKLHFKWHHKSKIRFYALNRLFFPDSRQMLLFRYYLVYSHDLPCFMLMYFRSVHFWGRKELLVKIYS